jgi:L-seryl-tRNA(Ser) seleniumtransferase
MASVGVAELRSRARDISVGKVIDVASAPGGGTLPGVEIPSVGLAMVGDHRQALRERQRPLIARTIGNDTIVDLRTIHPDDDEEVAAALAELGE